MSVQPFELFVLKLGNEAGHDIARRAVKSPDIASKWMDGWTLVYAWIAIEKTIVNGQPAIGAGAIDVQYLMVVMAPPRPSDDQVVADAIGLHNQVVVESVKTAQRVALMDTVANVVTMLLVLALVAVAVWS